MSAVKRPPAFRYGLITFAPLVAAALLLAGCAAGGPAPQRATVARGTPSAPPDNAAALRRFVQQAAGRLQRDGENAFQAFAQSDSPWQQRGTFLFVMTSDGTVRYHDSSPHLVGRDVSTITDVDGRPFAHWQLEPATGPRETTWVFYKWPPPNGIQPVWTATYVQRVSTDANTWLIGAGVPRLNPDATLLEAVAKQAAAQLQRAPAETRRRLRDAQGPYVYRDMRVIVVDGDAEPTARPSAQKVPVSPPLPRGLTQWLRDGGTGLHTVATSASGNKPPPAQQVFAEPVSVNGDTRLVLALRPAGEASGTQAPPE